MMVKSANRPTEKVMRRCLLLLALLAAAERPARAYVDPGSGALLWQMVAAGFLGALFQVRKFIARLRRRRRPRN